MRLSTRGEYSIRAMLELALHFYEGPISAKYIAEKQHLSHQYLMQLLTNLRTADLVRVVRGANGGFILTNPPNKITIKEIIQVTEGSTALMDCVDNACLCPLSDLCPIRELWIDIKCTFDSLLGSTLKNLVDRKSNIKSDST